jgi:hypothetical protein
MPILLDKRMVSALEFDSIPVKLTMGSIERALPNAKDRHAIVLDDDPRHQEASDCMFRELGKRGSSRRELETKSLQALLADTWNCYPAIVLPQIEAAVRLQQI